MGLLVIFLPSYSPELAQIEKVFAGVKRGVGECAQSQVVDFQDARGDKIILRMLGSLGQAQRVRFWKEWINMTKSIY